jgi:hypothetical protein
VLAGKDIARAAHIGGKLVNFIEAAVHDGGAKPLIAQIANGEIVGHSGGKLGELKVYAADPEAFLLEAPDQMGPNETTSTANKRRAHQSSTREYQERKQNVFSLQSQVSLYPPAIPRAQSLKHCSQYSQEARLPSRVRSPHEGVRDEPGRTGGQFIAETQKTADVGQIDRDQRTLAAKSLTLAHDREPRTAEAINAIPAFGIGVRGNRS